MSEVDIIPVLLEKVVHPAQVEMSQVLSIGNT